LSIAQDYTESNQDDPSTQGCLILRFTSFTETDGSPERIPSAVS